MSKPLEPGRVDKLAHEVFDRLLKQYGPPQLRLACLMLEKEIGKCLEEHLGPGTTVHEAGERLSNALRRFE